MCVCYFSFKSFVYILNKMYKYFLYTTVIPPYKPVYLFLLQIDHLLTTVQENNTSVLKENKPICRILEKEQVYCTGLTFLSTPLKKGFFCADRSAEQRCGEYVTTYWNITFKYINNTKNTSCEKKKKLLMPTKVDMQWATVIHIQTVQLQIALTQQWRKQKALIKY